MNEPELQKYPRESCLTDRAGFSFCFPKTENWAWSRKCPCRCSRSPGSLRGLGSPTLVRVCWKKLADLFG